MISSCHDSVETKAMKRPSGDGMALRSSQADCNYGTEVVESPLSVWTKRSDTPLFAPRTGPPGDKLPMGKPPLRRRDEGIPEELPRRA